MPQCPPGPSPRIFIYDIPQSLLRRPTPWRLVYDVGAWIRKSPHWERQGDCADYFFVPMHPENMVNGRMTGDASFARLYAYIRETWPYWNRTVDAGTARHFHMLPCDHGPGDCGYDRPLIPNKWSPGMHSLVQQNQRNHVVGFLNRSDANYIRRTWGGMWEQLNPSSPARLVFYLVYNGWADQLRSKVGQCRSCFHAGLDVRATPPAHTHVAARAHPSCNTHLTPIALRRSADLMQPVLTLSFFFCADPATDARGARVWPVVRPRPQGPAAAEEAAARQPRSGGAVGGAAAAAAARPAGCTRRAGLARFAAPRVCGRGVHAAAGRGGRGAAGQLQPLLGGRGEALPLRRGQGGCITYPAPLHRLDRLHRLPASVACIGCCRCASTTTLSGAH